MTATLLCLGAPSPAQELLESLRFDPIANNLDRPVSITHPGDGSGRLFIVEQRGRIFVHNGTSLLGTPFLDIDSLVSGGSERGLLGLAFHPDYEENGYFYVNYTDNNGDTVIARYEVSSDPNVADESSERVLLRRAQPFTNHNAGELQFGPDGYLYFGLGDGGGSGDPDNRGQTLTVLLGKMLRIDVDGDFPYAIPPSNPFANSLTVVAQQAARPEIWAYGLRNPWRFSFDRETGDLFIADVGQDKEEEVNFQPASSAGGQNYGWRRMEGTRCFNPDSNCNDGSLTLPILTYSTGVAGDCSITGGYRYRGPQYPQLNGVYFYGDYCSGLIRAAVQQGANWTQADTLDTSFAISTFGEDENGELYVADHSGRVYRIGADHPAPRLSTISPRNAPAGSGAFTLMIRGSDFVPGAQVTWNGEARPTTFVANESLEAAISGEDIAAQGVVEVAVVNPAPGGGDSVTLEFVIAEAIPLMPSINEGGAVNAASFAGGAPVSPGSIVSVFGDDLAAGLLEADAVPLPTTLNGTTLRFGDSLAAPQFFQSPMQVNIQVPWELEGQDETTLQADVAGVVSGDIAVALAAHSPGLFSMTQTGSGQGAILISGAGLLAAEENAVPGAPSRPVRRGEFLEVYASGLGPVVNPPASGSLASSVTLSPTTSEATVTIGGEEAAVSFAGLAPGFVGLYQVNLEVPQNAPSGGAVELVLRIGGAVSNAVTVAVE
jgi:uncharacterized protein (TIGR03437 family)